MAEKTRCCENCLPCRQSDFKKVVVLQNSGLKIYLHTGKDDQKNKAFGKNVSSIIIHNTNSRELNKPDYMRELCRCKTNCSRCEMILQSVRSLLDEIIIIKENEVIGICDHCMRANTTEKCRKCDFIVSKFLADNKKNIEERQERFRNWLLKVKHLLKTILNAHSLCKHMTVRELERILKELNAPLSSRMPDIEGISQSITETKEMFEELWLKINSEDPKNLLPAEVSLAYVDKYQGTCICKLLKEGQLLPTEMSALVKKDGEYDFQKYSGHSATDSEKKLKLIVTGTTKSETVVESGLETQPELTFTDKIKSGAFVKSGLETQPELTFTDKIKSGAFVKSGLKTQLKPKLNGKSKSVTFVKSGLETQKGPNFTGKTNFGINAKSASQMKSDQTNSVKSKPGLNTKTGLKKQPEQKIYNKPKAGLIAESQTKTKSSQTISGKSKPVLNTKTDETKTKSSQKKTVKSKTEEDKKTALKNDFDRVLQDLMNQAQLNKEKERLFVKKMKIEEVKIKERARMIRKKATATESLPEITAQKLSEQSQDDIEEGVRRSIPNYEYMVKGNYVVPYLPYHKQDLETQQPVFFNKVYSYEVNKLGTSVHEKETTGGDQYAGGIINQSPVKGIQSSEQAWLPKPAESERDGLIRYKLSDRKFIDNGWTQLPTEKVLRKMNIYKMNPAYSQYDWFKKYKSKNVLYYDSGEKLANVDENGRALWFYKNGELALEYFNAEAKTDGQRCIVYSSSDEFDCGKPKPRTVVGLFDFLGNGVIYDTNGNVRLKYNQSEGVVVDPKIGPPGRWKWHALNDPPNMKTVLLNVKLPQTDLYIKRMGELLEDTPTVDDNAQKAAKYVSQIELSNYAKENSKRMSQVFKPFQIKMKAAKLSDNFSLKIIDQSNIYLMFRDGQTSLKLNLGMHLNSKKIIDTDVSEATEVSTPYDKHPPQSESITNIQQMMQQIKKSKSKVSNFNKSMSIMAY